MQHRLLHHQSVLPKSRSSTANSGTRVAVLLGINRCVCFPLLSVCYINTTVISPRAGLSLQTQKSRLEFCPKAGLSLQIQEPRLQFHQGQIGVIASCCFPRVISSSSSSSSSSLSSECSAQGRSFAANAGTKVAVLSKGRSSTANSGTKVAVLLGINRWGSFPLLSLYYIECSAQGQVLHFKLRNQGCSYAVTRSFTPNSRTQAAVLPGMNR